MKIGKILSRKLEMMWDRVSEIKLIRLWNQLMLFPGKVAITEEGGITEVEAKEVGNRGRGQRYTPYGRGGGEKCRNCKKLGHHHTECYAPSVCFKCGASTKDHYSYECPQAGNKDKNEKYLSLVERMCNIQFLINS